MKAINPQHIGHRGVYQCINELMVVEYVGQSYLSLSRLEDNHRNWRTKEDRYGNPYEGTTFRLVVENKPQWRFGWLVEPRPCTIPEIECWETLMIHATGSWQRLNVDRNTVATSIEHGRYTRDDVPEEFALLFGFKK